MRSINDWSISCIVHLDKDIHVITYRSDWRWDSQFLEVGFIELGISFGYIKSLVCRRSKSNPCEFFDESFSLNSSLWFFWGYFATHRWKQSYDTRLSFEIIDTSFVYVTSYIIINTYLWIFFELCFCKFFYNFYFSLLTILRMVLEI